MAIASLASSASAVDAVVLSSTFISALRRRELEPLVTLQAMTSIAVVDSNQAVALEHVRSLSFTDISAMSPASANTKLIVGSIVLNGDDDGDGVGGELVPGPVLVLGDGTHTQHAPSSHLSSSQSLCDL